MVQLLLNLLNNITPANKDNNIIIYKVFNTLRTLWILNLKTQGAFFSLVKRYMCIEFFFFYKKQLYSEMMNT